MKLTVHHSGKFYKGVTKELKSPQQLEDRLTYSEGTTVEADGLDDDPTNGCGCGINFCRSIAEALKWGPVVVEISLPEDTVLVDTGSKLRARRVIVGPRADLSTAKLYGADLWGADLSGANLYRANLSRANLSRANLSWANLFGANLSRANLSGANLSRANLYGADLYGADLYGADLWGADLSGANLYRANLYGAYLSGANGDVNTTLPDGYELSGDGLIVKKS